RFLLRGVVRLGRRGALPRSGGEPPPALPDRPLGERRGDGLRQCLRLLRRDDRLDPELAALLEPAIGLSRLTQPAGEPDLAEGSETLLRGLALCGRGDRERDREVGTRLV